MSTAVLQSWRMTQRHLLALARQPYYVAITLVQPVIWLVLFGGLFRRVVEIPGFGADSYLVFLVPGIIVMSSLFSNGWSGMGVVEDLDRGVVDRFLVTPVRRSALLNGRVAMQAVVCVVQSIIILLLALAMGARFPGGVRGAAVLVAVAVVLGAAVASFSHALALIVRREESVIAMSQFVVLPATFVSSAFLVTALAPEWIQSVARWNPVNWAIDAGRGAMGAEPDWGAVGSRLGALTLLAVAAAALATRAFGRYQASV